MFAPLKKYIFPILIAAVVGVFLLLNNNDTDESTRQLNPVAEEESATSSEAEQPDANVMVDVKGEIREPGVYEIEAESRVNDVIRMAGGFTEDADQTTVNLAQKVQDEMVIMIPKSGEQGQAAASEDSSNEKVRINYADKKEIERLNGIGPSKSEAIIQYRDENGFFETADDLLDVSGIGEKTLESIREDIQVP
ncbi:helix-hairpin-helix domain-containing protein [Lentibacillus sp.]|uniref:helix-hairpin-helix domain-containing protein n=1 Tax=Lentibacillus sp. TaxID=1925746 RepID=UPI002B4AD2C3|nr:helix-hairpin-helix domain-containing protein [Lentibacillus sp.]HLS07623.1 helix-hairpin-helix domain-containing protein [Lentibacillus sp.]